MSAIVDITTALVAFFLPKNTVITGVMFAAISLWLFSLKALKNWLSTSETWLRSSGVTANASAVFCAACASAV